MAGKDIDESRVPGSTGSKPSKPAKPEKPAKLTRAQRKAAKGDESVEVVDLAEPKAKKRKLFSFVKKPTGEKKKTTAKKSAKRKGSGLVSKIAYIVLITLAVVALAFMLLNQDAGGINNPTTYLGSVFAPVQDALSSAAKFVRNVVTGAQNYVQLIEDNEKYRLENDALKIQLSLTADDANEKERLQKLLGAKNAYTALDAIYAKVIGKDPGVWFDTFSINRGTSSGVKANMAVITSDGLAGRVFEVGLNYAKVMSVIDPRSAVTCLIERTRDNGVMRGQISQESTTSECNMYYLPVVNDIMPGDVVLTSGIDMLFPKGLTVGTVQSVSRQSDLSDQFIVVLPAVDFLHLEDVLVLRTQVETDSDEAMPVLFTPTPKPTVEASPTPTPLATEPDIDDDDAIWRYPSAVTGVVPDETPVPSQTPSVTFDPNAMPAEDAWSIGG